MKMCYEPELMQFRSGDFSVIEKAKRLLEAFGRQGFRLTPRQLYYQLIARNSLPPEWVDAAYNRSRDLLVGTMHTQRTYHRLRDLMDAARLAGLVDWNRIDDNSRNLWNQPHWASPREMVRECAQQFQGAMWANQNYYCEVWLEKCSLIGTIESICIELDLPFVLCGKRISQGEMHSAARRFQAMCADGRAPLILFLGDFDIDGLSLPDAISQDFERLGSGVEVRRIGLDWPQICAYDLPPNPVRPDDPEFFRKWGGNHWELDALAPDIVAESIRTEISMICDSARWDERKEHRERGREKFRWLTRYWPRLLGQFCAAKSVKRSR